MPEGKHETTTWTDADVYKQIYGTHDDNAWSWENDIVSALRGLVPLAVVVSVVRAAHNAFNEGGRQADYD